MATSDWDDAGIEDDAEDSAGFLDSDAGRKRIDATNLPTSQILEAEKKSATFWIGTVALFLLLVAVIGGGLYVLVQPSVEEQAFYATDAEEAAPADASTVEVPPPPAPIALDTAPVIPSSETQNLASVAPGEDRHRSFATDKANADATVKPALQKPTSPSPFAPKPTASTSTAPKPSTPKPLVEDAAPVTADASVKPPTKKAEPAPTPAPKLLAPTKKDPTLSTKQAPTSSQPLYVVQVFSSPSRDDADEWLQRLRGKNVNDGYIAEQQIKGQPWYRVRFGQFNSKEDAEAEALKLGFKQPWVARVR